MKTPARILAALSLALTLLPSTTFATDTVHASRGTITLPTYPWTAVKHPYLRGTDRVNIYPYPMLDFLSRDPTNRTYRTVILENEYLRITFLPGLGGKIHEVIDKTTGQPMFYVNHVIKPALIGQAGAWTSGGVEWNTGPQGHTVGCMQPVDVVILPREKDGSQSVAVGETERIYGTKWTVVVTLRPGRSFIEERIRIYNPTETIRPYYFWNCTAAPNTKGFRFIYPMTLGTDHGAEKFFHWPVNEGKDLSRGTNYQDASSIFAWYCDQDFFGSYNDDLDRGVVAYANHHQLPGKKAWTWGWGSYGTMHQMDLTDDDGPYNEVQTGPLLTQGEVGRLDPCEAVEWQEWWYPIRGMGGFTFANGDVAANASLEGDRLKLRMIGTGRWPSVDVRLLKGTQQVAQATSELSADKTTELSFPLGNATETLRVELWGGAPLITHFDGNGVASLVPAEVQEGKRLLGRFRIPLDLPAREPPAKKAAPQTAAEFAQAGWEDFLFAHFPEAEGNFRKSLEKDPKCVEANIGLAHLNLDRDPATAAQAARAALAVSPDDGKARFALAVAEERLGEDRAALDDAWRATLDPARATAGRALAARILIRQEHYAAAVETLFATGPWNADPRCRDLLAVACAGDHRANGARRAALAALEIDPLDWAAIRVLGTENLPADDERRNPAFHVSELSGPRFPYRREDEPVLRRTLAQNPRDGQAALYLGHLLFHLGRHSEGREMWKRAAELGAEPAIAYRALGMSAKTLDNDLKSARQWLEKANQADPTDAIVARDLANVLFALTDQAGSETEKHALTTEARDRLQGAFEQGKGRSDFIALLARSHSRLGDSAATAKLLDSVRITIWEGAHEAHDLFEEAHLALGDQLLSAGHAAEALAEYNRALEYPKNLATGRLESAREAHIEYRRGQALAALGRTEEARAAWRKAVDEPASGDAKREEARKKANDALDAPAR